MTISVNDDIGSSGSSGTLLSGVSLNIYIDHLMTQLEDVVSPATSRIVNYEGADLTVRDSNVFIPNPEDDGYLLIASFANRADALTFAENNADKVRNSAHTQLNTLRKFKKARENNDIEAQKEMFEGVYLIVATNLGETEARRLRADFNTLVLRNHLQIMVDATLSGWNNEKELTSYRERPVGSVATGGEEAAKASRALHFLLERAGQDRYGVELHNKISGYLKEYRRNLLDSEDEELKNQADEVNELLDIFDYLTLMPKTVETIETKK